MENSDINSGVTTLNFDRAQGVFLGLAVGDALGASLEFSHPMADDPDTYLREMVGGGWLSLPPGEVTDDTEMTLALAHSMVENGGDYSRAMALSNYQAWRAGGPRDIGMTVGGSLGRIASGVSPDQAAKQLHVASGGRSAGNGALMRIAPLALRYCGSIAELNLFARQDSALTHWDPLSSLACSHFLTQIAALIYPSAANLAAAAQLAEPLGAESSDLADFAPFAPYRNQGSDGLSDGQLALIWEQVQVAYGADRIETQNAIHSQMGFVLTALKCVGVAEREFDNFEDALIWVVNQGGDSDTNGAIAGAFLGAKYGASAIPKRWLDTLVPASEIEILTAQLLGAAGFDQ